jgi:hypothetical protein
MLTASPLAASTNGLSQKDRYKSPEPEAQILPQGLKPAPSGLFCGTAEAVPFH